jgi:hypothetical protein
MSQQLMEISFGADLNKISYCIEQMEKDLESDKEALNEAKFGTANLRKELDQLNKKYTEEDVSLRRRLFWLYSTYTKRLHIR